MGPNGSGKSTLSHTLMGHPGYTVDGGQVILKGQNVLALEPDERARLGMFLEFIKPDFVHVLVDGKFVLSGGPEVADRLEKTGYSEWGHTEEEPKEVA